jgi:methionyl-tRNA formyltransferase
MHRDKKRIVFMGSSDFSLYPLEALYQREKALGDIQIVGVYTQPPRLKGRGLSCLEKNIIHRFGDLHEIPVYTPDTLRTPKEQEFLGKEVAPDLIVVASYGLIIPKGVLEIPGLGCVNLHPSLLPRWRGASPIQHTLLHGDVRTGVTLMMMDAGVDTGPIIAQDFYSMESLPDTFSELTEVLSEKNGDLLLHWLPSILKGDCPLKEQSTHGVTLAGKLSKNSGILDWRKDAQELVWQVNALEPWPGSYFMLEGKRIKVTKGAVWSGPGKSVEASYPVGGVFLDPFAVRCGKGWFSPLRVIPQGKKEMDAESFLRGARFDSGHVDL